MHEKLPCTQCGKMYGSLALPRHIRSTHTPNDQKNYKCEVCGKGFITNQRLKEHNNIHTDENPTSVNSVLVALLVKEHMQCMNEVTLVIVANTIKNN